MNGAHSDLSRASAGSDGRTMTAGPPCRMSQARVGVGALPRRASPGLRRLDPATLGDHVDRLYRAARAICGSREEAEDLVQDTFARVLQKPRWPELGGRHWLSAASAAATPSSAAGASPPPSRTFPGTARRRRRVEDLSVGRSRRRASTPVRSIGPIASLPASVSRRPDRGRRDGTLLPRGLAGPCGSERRPSRPVCTERGSAWPTCWPTSRASIPPCRAPPTRSLPDDRGRGPDAT